MHDEPTARRYGRLRTPSVRTRRCLIVVPAFGKIEYTHALIPDLLGQHRWADILVVDNKGDYSALADERVIRPVDNIGWAAASNLGFRMAFSEGYSHAMTLNNDTRLSDDFMAGILDPRLPEDGGVIAPVYDDFTVHRQQLSDYRGPAAFYRPNQRYRSTLAVDGTALCITKAAWLAVGDLDSRSFGRYGWGADIDLCYRIHRAGYGVYITEVSYLNHLRKVTAGAASSYEELSLRDAVRGFERLYGPQWMNEFGLPAGLHSEDGFPMQAFDFTSTPSPAEQRCVHGGG
jgi:GT2 family glycosyltransferase